MDVYATCVTRLLWLGGDVYTVCNFFLLFSPVFMVVG